MKELPGIIFDHIQNMQQPFISFAIDIEIAGAEFRQGSADKMGQCQTDGNLFIMVRRG